jgi:metal-responsive CopG/Arc/MetJ family transcriptional regulator
MCRGMRVVSFKIPDDLLRELDQVVLELETNRSALLRSLIEEFLRKKKGQIKPHIGRGIKIW